MPSIEQPLLIHLVPATQHKQNRVILVSQMHLNTRANILVMRPLVTLEALCLLG
jgi:hypothetical protein